MTRFVWACCLASAGRLASSPMQPLRATPHFNQANAHHSICPAHRAWSSRWKGRRSRGDTPSNTARLRYMYSPPAAEWNGAGVISAAQQAVGPQPAAKAAAAVAAALLAIHNRWYTPSSSRVVITKFSHAHCHTSHLAHTQQQHSGDISKIQSCSPRSAWRHTSYVSPPSHWHTT